MTYEEQLKDERWIAKRQEIIDRDWGYCTKCMSTKNLQVHHLYYAPNKMAWEYPGNALITLCRDCHQLEHDKVPERGRTITIRQAMVEFVRGIMNLKNV